MHRSVMPGARRVSLLLGLGALAVTSVGLAPAAVAESVDSDWVTLISGTDLQSAWDIENDLGTTDGTVKGDGCQGAYPGIGVNDAGYNLGGATGGPYLLASGGYQDDAFDEGLLFFAGAQQLAAPATWDVEQDADGVDRAVTAGPIAVEPAPTVAAATGGVDATVEYRAMPTQQVLRSTVWLANKGADPVTVPFTVGTNLGSDDSTTVTGSSTGDEDFSAADRWVVTADDATAPDDPVNTHVFAGPGQLTSPVKEVLSSVFDCAGTEGVGATYNVTLQPGQTRGLMFFNELSPDNATALEAAKRFDANPAKGDELLTGLTATQLGELVNWSFQAPAPPPPRDTTAPESKAQVGFLTTDTSWPVAYDATDGSSGVRQVDLFVRTPGATSYTLAGTDTTPVDGSFTYDATGGDGDYAFYTVATDNAGNVEAAPPSPDGVVTLDRTAPSSQVAAPGITSAKQLQLTYRTTGSDVMDVDLYVRAPGSSTYVRATNDHVETIDGKFTYTAAADGTYRFYTVATDILGNREAAPLSPDARTRVDSTAPVVRSRMGATPVLFDRREQRSLALRFHVSETTRATVEIRRHGTTVRRMGPWLAPRGLVERHWNGRADGQRRVPAGRYVVVLKVRDVAGNVSVLRVPVRVVH